MRDRLIRAGPPRTIALVSRGMCHDRQCRPMWPTNRRARIDGPRASSSFPLAGEPGGAWIPWMHAALSASLLDPVCASSAPRTYGVIHAPPGVHDRCEALSARPVSTWAQSRWHLALPRPPAGWATAAAVPRRDLREKTLLRATEGQRLMRSVRAQEDRARIHRVCARRRSPLQRRDRRTVPRSPDQNAALSHSHSFDDFGDSSAFAGPGSSSRRAAAALVMRIIECAGAAARECASAIACAP